MTYLINETRISEIFINGADVTELVTNITLSDSSGIKQGLIATDGTMTLNYRNGATPLPDYKRNLFARGTSVDIYIVFPSGSRKKHPRGSLVVLDTVFNPEDETVTVSVGCKMALAALTENVDELIDLVELYMPSTRRTYSGISAAIATMGKIAWYDSMGNLQIESLWSGETQISSPPEAWVSVFGLTALSVTSLNASRSFEVSRKSETTGVQYPYADPDNILLSYEFGACKYTPEGEAVECTEVFEDDDDAFTEEITTSESTFYTQYPAIFYERVPPKGSGGGGSDPENDEDQPSFGSVGTPDDEEGSEDGRSSACVDEPLELENPASSKTGGGSSNGQVSCLSGYQTARSQLLVGVKTRSQTTVKYEGPGRSRNYSISENYGPALQASSQYVGDVYQLCRQSWASKCNPNGFCSTDFGTQEVLLGREITTVEFNLDGSVALETKDSYETLISAMNPDSWRAGVNDGSITGFREIGTAFDLYRKQRTIVEYQYPKNGTYRKTTEFTAQEDWGSSVPTTTEMDALNGLVKVTVDRSRNNAINAEQPPTLATPEPQTFNAESEIVFPDHDNLSSPGGGSGSSANFKESVPYPILIRADTTYTVEGVLLTYEDYLMRIMKAQSLGLRVIEALREEVVDAWKPNQSWRYADPRYNTIMSLRGDAHTWNITPDFCHFGVDGLAVGFSDGELFVPDNVEGAVTPTID